MCGICGKINFNLEAVNEDLLWKMTNVLTHRGPDSGKIYIKDNVGLGHRRLRIIDLSEAAAQPMCNENNSIWIVCNGEIYNFFELRKNLEEKGHIFRSKCDTEVILHLYEEKGLDCVKFLRGMFAFAIWDENRKRLFLARDRVGKKPLNYALNDKTLVFSSEIKSLLEDSSIEKQVNLEALNLFLTYSYIPSPHTMFTGIKKLPPAHTLVWDASGMKIERYWNLSYRDKVNLTEEECAHRVLELLTESTKIRMVSDVPLGAFLSGGIDSSAVVGIMSKLSSRPVKTFSVGFPEKSFNELQYARKVAQIFNTEHKEYIVEYNTVDILPKLVWHFNEPFGDSSAVPTYYLSKMTREAVTVALNGDGGDESFAGYDRYAANILAERYKFMPTKLLSSVINSLPGTTSKRSFINRLKKFNEGLNLSKERRYAYWMSAFSSEAKESLYSAELKNKLKEIDCSEYLVNFYNNSDARDFIDATLSVDVNTYLSEDLLVKVDIASMANSLEARSPFLDHKLMEFAASIPSHLKLKGSVSKYILKKSLKDLLPPEILNRKKSGFGVPVGSWFKNELKDYAVQTLLSEGSLKRGYFRKEAIENLINEHNLNKVDHGHRLWNLINLELWHQVFIDK